MNIVKAAKKLDDFVKTASKKGPIELLGFFLREESELWDLIIAAPWLKSNERSSFEYVAGQLKKYLTDEELVGLSRIVILDHRWAVLNPLLNHFSNTSGLIDNSFTGPDGLIIKKAYIMICQAASDRIPKKRHPKSAAKRG